MAERASTRLWRAKWSQIILSALITGGTIGVLFSKESMAFAYGTVALSVLSLIFNSYLKDLDPGQLAQKEVVPVV
jgi:hypothetical protein